MSAELSSIRKYKKENEWGTKKVVKRDAIFLTLDLLGDHQWPSSSSFAACELFLTSEFSYKNKLLLLLLLLL